MPQPKPTPRSTTTKKAAASKPRTASKTTAKQPPAKRAAPKKAATTAKQTTVKPPARRAPEARSGSNGREEGYSSPANALLDFVARTLVITGERLQATIDDAVERGTISKPAGEDLVEKLLAAGRRQAEELRENLERLAEQNRDDVIAAGLRAGAQLAPDRVLREIDRFRRSFGVGPAFPILGYEDLSTAQIVDRLEDLNSAQLRKVRDYERHHAKRKTVLDRIESELNY